MDIVNKNSRISSVALVEGAFRALKEGDHLQIERRGFYIVDHCGVSSNNKYRLISIPDGKTKNMSTLSSKVDVKQLVKGDEKVKVKQEKKDKETKKEEKNKKDQKKKLAELKKTDINA
mmetsp:Transcript_80696/g.174486  ORF Transcript_80696/g.174486 Transcript_80696/m.174486 type:complete len:118 (-) Transcript_80696:919-1272(-)